MRVFLASRNLKKIAEMERILREHLPEVEVLGIDQVEGYDEPVEDQATFEGNALLKARAGVLATGLPSIADDSGLCVDALNGMPGVLSARWSGRRPARRMASESPLERLEAIQLRRVAAHDLALRLRSQRGDLLAHHLNRAGMQARRMREVRLKHDLVLAHRRPSFRVVDTQTFGGGQAQHADLALVLVAVDHPGGFAHVVERVHGR